MDDEESILKALQRVFRRDGYRILTASGAEEALKLLETDKADVIISDQRMPRMKGADFLQRVKERHPDTVRIVLSGYTDLDSVTDAINRGAIFKFLTKPWDDDLLRANVEEAFRYLGLERENQRLNRELQAANERLLQANRALERRVEEKTEEAMHASGALMVSQEVLDLLPVGILCIDSDELIVFANSAARQLLPAPENGLLLGSEAVSCLPPEALAMHRGTLQGIACEPVEIPLQRSRRLRLTCRALREQSSPRGTILLVQESTGSVQE